MPRAPHTRAPDARREAEPGAAPARPAPIPTDGPSRVLWLQRAAGNRAVAAQLARQPAPAPAAAPAGKVVGAPPPTSVEGPQPGADLGAGAETVTLTFVIRDLHLKGRDPTAIDWLHEPGVEVEATRGRVPQPVLSAGISALNYHLRIHGKDIAEVALGVKGGVDHEGTPEAGAEVKAQVAISATFSISAGTSLKASPEDGRVTLEWSPVSIGAQVKLGGGGDDGARPGTTDYGPDMAEGRIGASVASQLSRDELGPFEPTTIVDELLSAMNAAKGGEAQWAMHLGELADKEIPPGIVRTLARAADLIARAKPSLRRVTAVRVTMLRSDPATKQESAVRWFVLPVGGATVSATPAAAPAQRTWGAPD